MKFEQGILNKEQGISNKKQRMLSNEPGVLSKDSYSITTAKAHNVQAIAIQNVIAGC